MTEIVLHEDAFEEVRQQFADAGLLCDQVDNQFAVGDITFKLWEYVPTAEDIARHEAFRATPFGKIMHEMMRRQAQKTAEELLRIDADYAFISGEQWPVGTTLKIKLPNDYAGKS